MPFRLTISQRLWLGLGLILALFGAAHFVSVRATHMLDAALSDVVEDGEARNAAAFEMQIALDRMTGSAQAIADAPGPAQREQLADAQAGFILDGFPRNARQAEFFLEAYDIDGVINLELPDALVHERVLARRLCSGCGLDWNLLAHRPKVPDVCDICHSALVVREDDHPEALAVRLRDYHEKTKPVIELFQRKEFVASIDATAPVNAIQTEIRRRFNLPALRT